MMEQKKDGWCGPAALSYGLKKQGIEASQEEIAKETKTTVERGVDPNPLVRFVDNLKLQTKVFTGKDAEQTLDDITHFLYFDYSCLVDYLAGDSEEDGHYVVIQDIDDKYITIWDPEGGEQKELYREDFIDHWRDYTSNGKVFKHWALCFKKLTQ